jgi:AraC family L-rhamnose operon regulatory protein RhaS
MTQYKTYHAGEFFEPNFHFTIRKEVNNSCEFNLDNRFQREFWKITFITSGSGQVIINDQSYPISPGAIYLVHPKAVTTYNINGEKLELYNILFDKSFLGSDLETLKDERDFFAIFANPSADNLNPLLYIQNTNKTIKNLINNMYTEYQNKEANYKIYLKLKLLELLILMQRSGNKKLRKLTCNELTSYLNHLLESDYQNNISLKYLAEKVGITPNHLCTIYRQNTNTSIVQKLKEIRLQKAEKLLTKTQLTISEICFECGFNDLSYFYRTFVTVYKCNPGNYRKKFGINTTNNID